MISQETIQQIQSRIDIVEIIGSFIKLKKRGANYLGLCPFHNEKSPSFTVSPSKEIYKCFGCGKSGNTIGFVMEHEKYSYVEALRWLAQKYNVEIEEKEVSPEFRQTQLVSDSLFIINNFAKEFFQNALFNSDEGRDIGLSYLKERGFREEILRKFQVGYNPSAKDQLATAAVTAKFNPDYLQKTGLIVSRDGSFQDNYRGRIIFPVHNQSGKILGFGARLIKNNDKAPKYINTPENEIYIKSRILYGSYFARMAIDKADECLLVEGYTDVLSLHQAGIENVVASGGTSLTPDQLRLIKKYTNNLTIIYDGDSAGIKAALRGLDLALEESLNVKLVLIPDKEDPDSYVNKIGASAFIEFIQANKKDFILFKLSLALEEAGNDTAKKSALVNQIAETISKINKAEEFTRRQDYTRQVSEILKIDEAGLNDLVNKFVRESVKKDEVKQSAKNAAENLPDEKSYAETGELTSLFNKDEPNEQAFVRNLLEFGLMQWAEGITVADHLLDQYMNQDLDLENAELIRIIEIYKTWYNEGLQPTAKNFLYHDDSALSSLVIRIMDTQTEISPNWKEHFEGHIATRKDLYKEEIQSSLSYLQLRKLKKLIEQNQKDMLEAKTLDDQMIYLKVHQELKEMEKILTRETGTVIFK